ncbi:MAG: phosphoglycerate kinase [Verrucomicrobia bacterium]|nr:MAG: phosphoglycerate kinase [Verrucomicrobiota bacterium]
MNAASSAAALLFQIHSQSFLLMSKLSVRDLSLAGKRVLLRVDFNVPTEENDGHTRITDDTRIKESLPTINHLRAAGAKVIVMAHFGRPKGTANLKYTLRPVSEHLSKLLNAPVGFSTECVGEIPAGLIAGMHDGDVLLLENVRFHGEEEANDEGFAKELAALGEIYVNDAFGAAHRAHASTAGVAHHVPTAAMGLLMEKELRYLQGELKAPARPFVVILGGSKVSDKIGVIKALMEKADTFLIGGAMAYTFFRALGIPTGKSRVEADKVDLAKEILELAKAKGVRFLLPLDNLETQEISATAQPRSTGLVSPEKGVSEGWEAVDIGPETISLYRQEIAGAKTVLWNGPVGIFELAPFASGTRSIAEAVAASSAVTIIGGGDSVTAVKQFGLGEKVSFCSTGGGASLELIEGKVLPGVAALTDKV